MVQVSSSYQNYLGLSVGATFAFLGSIGFIAPARLHDLFDDDPSSAATNKVSGLAYVVASRDLTLAAIIINFGLNGQRKEMGTVILSTMMLCAIDVWIVLRKKKYLEYVLRSLQ